MNVHTDVPILIQAKTVNTVKGEVSHRYGCVQFFLLGKSLEIIK